MRFVLFLFLVAICGPAFAQGVTAAPDLRRMQTGGVDVAALFEARFPATLALLKAEFPADRRVFDEGLAIIDGMAGEENALLTLAFSQLTDLRRHYEARLRFATSERQAAMLGQLAVLYDLVLKEEGAEVCGRLARDGTAALFEANLSEKYAELIDRQSVAYFEAVISAIEAPEPSEAMQPDDLKEIMGRLIEAGAPPSFPAAIAAGDPANPELCPALATLFLTISLMETPAAARARADFAQNLAGY